MEMETETVRRRVEMITAHLSAADSIISATAGVFPLIRCPVNCWYTLSDPCFAEYLYVRYTLFIWLLLLPQNCSGGLTSIKTRGDNRMHFARQDSRSQGGFMRQASTEQVFSGQSSLPFMSTRSHKDGPSALVTPLFSQPSSINFDAPKVRNLQYAVDDCMLPLPEPPKFARTTIEKDVPAKFIPKNSTQTTKHLGIKEKPSPRMDVAESGGKYILLIELPGFSKDDIRVEVHNTNLTVQTTKGRTATCSFGDRARSSAYYRREILEGPFEIVWPLPFDVNPDSVSAEFL
ncbi:hypothetical protein OSB04_008769 [Centaurea solstitialis]|uniref:SHSP domain-containing protein n=1 Tax=Centaurea solstitialis TaxID=347529 RepID=A0AA38TMI5_9ASTR|nr:hypothetical protein OSB04_008769 [Centaurea solstitialis]